MIWTAVMMMIMNRCPAPRAQKKPAIMTSVHTVRVMKFAFFFSYSLWGMSAALGSQSTSQHSKEKGASVLEAERRHWPWD